MNGKLYRYCSSEELNFLLENDYLSPKNLRFISLSTDIGSLDKTEFQQKSDYLVVFDKEKIFSQGAIEIIYDFSWFISQDISILKHVTTYNDFDEFESECYQNGETPDSYLEMYSHEKEVIIPKIKNVINLILDIIPTKKTEKELNKQIIGYL